MVAQQAAARPPLSRNGSVYAPFLSSLLTSSNQSPEIHTMTNPINTIPGLCYRVGTHQLHPRKNSTEVDSLVVPFVDEEVSG